MVGDDFLYQDIYFSDLPWTLVITRANVHIFQDEVDDIRKRLKIIIYNITGIAYNVCLVFVPLHLVSSLLPFLLYFYFSLCLL